LISSAILSLTIVKICNIFYFLLIDVCVLGLVYLDKLLEGYDKMNYIGLGSNNIHNIQALLRHIGKRVLSPEQLTEYRQKE